jgi:hypothetical protein
VLLLDVFACPESTFDPAADEEARALESLPKLRFRFSSPPWRRAALAEQPDRRQIVKALPDFQRNFDSFCGDLLKGLDYDNVLVAGGSVLYNLLNQERRDWFRCGSTVFWMSSLSKTLLRPPGAGCPMADWIRGRGLGRWYTTGGARRDVDVFLYGMDTKAALAKINHLYSVREGSQNMQAGSPA